VLLSSQTELADDGAVALNVLFDQVIQQPAALSNHHQQSTAGMMILLMLFQMFRELVDSGGQQRYLDLGRAGIALVSLEVADYIRLSLFE
jgi:hypothetical protein